MKRVLILLHIILCTCIVTQAKNYTVSSPDGKTKVTVTAGKQLSWSINYNGERILNPSLMQMDIEGQTEQPGVNPKVIKAKTLKVNSEQTAVIPLKQRIIKDQYNQLTLTCKGNYAIVFRVYNNGAAYRFETSLKQPKVIINTETIEQNWTEGCKLYWPREKNQEYLTHCEAIFDELNISSLTNDMKGYLPIYLSTPKGTKVVIMESDLFDYPNLFLTGDRNNTLSGEFPPVVLKSALKEGTDRDEVLLEKASYIAETEGTRAFPWRVLMINEDDKAVIENNLVYQLASPSVTQDTEWIKPGKISWDWWSTLNVYGVDFKAGVNTDTYKYFIDFASKYGIEYILLDEGWSAGTWNIKEAIPELNIPELVRYGKERNVGLVLWTLWNPLDKDLEGILDIYEKWGIKGIKVDFMQRSDQYMVNFYERVGKAAMDRKLLVDFHGSFKPAGLEYKYPNVLSYEGVRGMEQMGGCYPDNSLYLPFMRNAVGPMDYTPGAMISMQPNVYRSERPNAASIGTRAYQLALFVVFESGLQMLADNPTLYYRNEDCTRFITQVPVTWDETVALEAKAGEYVIVAKRKGDKWFIGGMTNNGEKEREFTIKLDFLNKDRSYQMTSFEDGINAGRQAMDYRCKSSQVKAGEQLTIKMVRNGGFAAVIE